MIVAYNATIGEIHSVHNTGNIDVAKSEALTYLRDHIPFVIREQVEREIAVDKHYLTNHGILFYDIGDQSWVNEVRVDSTTIHQVRDGMYSIFRQIRTAVQAETNPFRARIIAKALITYFKRTLNITDNSEYESSAYRIEEFRRGDNIVFRLFSSFSQQTAEEGANLEIPISLFPSDQYEPVFTETVNTKAQDIEQEEHEV